MSAPTTELKQQGDENQMTTMVEPDEMESFLALPPDGKFTSLCADVCEHIILFLGVGIHRRRGKKIVAPVSIRLLVTTTTRTTYVSEVNSNDNFSDSLNLSRVNVAWRDHVHGSALWEDTVKFQFPKLHEQVLLQQQRAIEKETQSEELPSWRSEYLDAVAKETVEFNELNDKEASDYLGQIGKEDMACLRSLKCPPAILKRIFDGIALLLHAPLDKNVGCEVIKGRLWITDSWSSGWPTCGRELAQESLLLKHLDSFSKNEKEYINAETREFLLPYLWMPEFTKEKAMQACGNLQGLCVWVRAMHSHINIAQVVHNPRREKPVKKARDELLLFARKTKEEPAPAVAPAEAAGKAKTVAAVGRAKGPPRKVAPEKTAVPPPALAGARARSRSSQKTSSAGGGGGKGKPTTKNEREGK